MDVFFGWGLKFGAGSSPSVAINANKEMVMAHIPSGHTLAYRQGTRQHATVAWTPDESYGDGRQPSIAISRTQAVEVHRAVDDDDDRLFYGLGTLSNGRILWLGSGKYDEGKDPTVAINDSGFVLEIHRSQNTGRLWYNIGLISGNGIAWKKKDDFADGGNPAVSMNNAGQAIVVYTGDTGAYYRLLTTNGTAIEIQAEHLLADGASHPSAAVTDQGTFIACYNVSGDLMQRVGTIDGTTVSWGEATRFDEGTATSVAAQNDLAVQVHESQSSSDEFFSTSIITDRSNWMGNRIGELGTLPLRELVLPGSHNSGMYTGGDLGFAQNKNVYQQLTYGLRWFDLRVSYLGLVVYEDLYIHHGETFGAKLTEVLDHIRDFMEKGGRELVLLKFSHFGSTTGGEFTKDQYNQMVKYIDDRLGPWLYRGPLPAGKRLSDLTLTDYDGSVVVVVGERWARDYPHPGFWVYRDATSGNAAEGDLRVYDEYSDTDSYDSMKKDQIGKFNGYTGLCQGDGMSPCDLFLLSWTLTSTWETVYAISHTPNQHLADEVGKMPPTNSYGRIINIPYVDYVQYARPSDVAIAEKDTGGTHG